MSASLCVLGRLRFFAWGVGECPANVRRDPEQSVELHVQVSDSRVGISKYGSCQRENGRPGTRETRLPLGCYSAACRALPDCLTCYLLARELAPLRVCFEYDIFAYGGIDVNRALGVAHEYHNQREIAFAGGILPEIICSAHEYAGAQMVRI